MSGPVDVIIRWGGEHEALTLTVTGDIAPEEAWELLRGVLGQKAERPWNQDWNRHSA